ncbi:exopolysaccharide biosynthesis protein [Pelagibius sp. CAU 1746]|uniref:exopolysaccharide biosynthesis protein n=1 Tax=Pelagibius sp. CAU 1746 TaxID=3140370 RepID=UPI00325B45DE
MEVSKQGSLFVEVAMRVPTSIILEGLLRDAPSDVTLEWIVANLKERSFGIVMLLIALVGLVPGLSPVVGILLAIPAVQMILGRNEPLLPRRLAARRISQIRLRRILRRLIPVVKRLERIIRPRWAMPFETTKRAVGFVILLLGATLLVPVPLSNIVPTLAIMLLAFAFLEEDGLLLCVALTAAAVSFAVTAAAIWGTIEASRL